MREKICIGASQQFAPIAPSIYHGRNMLLCFFNATGAYVGYARFDDAERLQICKIHSDTGEQSLTGNETLSFPLPVGAVNAVGDSAVFIQDKRSGEPGFVSAFLRRMQRNKLFGVLFEEEERIDIWRKFLQAGFKKELQARYATLLALWPKEDLAFWNEAITTTV